MRPLFQAERSARMVGTFGISMTDPPVHHALPKRQPDVDPRSISQDADPSQVVEVSPKPSLLLFQLSHLYI